MASERHAGPVNDGELPGEVTLVSARCGGPITGAAATAAAAGAASRVLPTPGVNTKLNYMMKQKGSVLKSCHSGPSSKQHIHTKESSSPIETSITMLFGRRNEFLCRKTSTRRIMCNTLR